MEVPERASSVTLRQQKRELTDPIESDLIFAAVRKSCCKKLKKMPSRPVSIAFVVLFLKVTARQQGVDLACTACQQGFILHKC